VLRIYRAVESDEPLSQGDIFLGIPLPDISFREPYELIDGEQTGVLTEKQVEGDFQDGMNFVATIDLVNAVVLDQSCETLGADRILLAPIVDLRPKGNLKEQHQYIQRLGNTLAEPSRIYLAEEPELGFPKRIIDLAGKFHHTREDMEYFVKRGMRKAALGSKNLAYLRDRLRVYFAREARDDMDWLSRDDIRNKIKYLQDEVHKKKDGIKNKEAERAKCKTDEDRCRLEDDIDARQRVLRDIEIELASSEKTLAQLEEQEKRPIAQILPADDSHEPNAPQFVARAEAIDSTVGSNTTIHKAEVGQPELSRLQVTAMEIESLPDDLAAGAKSKKFTDIPLPPKQSSDH